jgi:hypothetical protein
MVVGQWLKVFVSCKENELAGVAFKNGTLFNASDGGY